jgi:hypothetical protein
MPVERLGGEKERNRTLESARIDLILLIQLIH